MRNMSLKWLIFSFYLIFGYLPLMLISFLTITDYSRSVESITEDRMLSLVRQVSDQTNMFYRILCKDLELLGEFPGTRFALMSLPQGRNRTDLEDDLRLFSEKNGFFDSLSIYSHDGRLIVTSVAPRGIGGGAAHPFSIPAPGAGRFLIRETSQGEAWDYEIVATLFNDQDQANPAGFVAAGVGLEKFTTFLSKADMGYGTETLILDNEGKVLWQKSFGHAPKQTVLQKTREYSAKVEDLGWRLTVRVPESVLLGDVNRLVVQNLVFTALVALFAAAAAFEFSRRTSNHLKKILQGARTFASGDLEHRIDVNYGSETRALADEFNLMAQKMSERQSELIQANKLASLGLLSAGIAHEIKNPLAGIKTSAQVLQELAEPGGPPGSTGTMPDEMETSTIPMTLEERRQIKELAGGVRQEVDRLTRILNSLLDFARPRPSRQAACNLAGIMDRALNLVESEIRKKRIEVVNSIEPVQVEVDPDQMLQIMVNLLLNAIWAVEPGTGRITLLTSWNEENMPVLVIADNGPGIPPEVIDRIYDPFFSLNKTGTGLGLSVVYSLLSQNNVHIKAGNADGGGAAFRLTFRAASPAGE